MIAGLDQRVRIIQEPLAIQIRNVSAAEPIRFRALLCPGGKSIAQLADDLTKTPAGDLAFRDTSPRPGDPEELNHHLPATVRRGTHRSASGGRAAVSGITQGVVGQSLADAGVPVAAYLDYC